MTRRILTAALLLMVAAAAHGMDASRASANSGGGSCPEAQAEDMADAAADAASTDTRPVVVPAPATTTVGGKAANASRPRSGARWHSFLPGMFK